MSTAVHNAIMTADGVSHTKANSRFCIVDAERLLVYSGQEDTVKVDYSDGRTDFGVLLLLD